MTAAVPLRSHDTKQERVVLCHGVFDLLHIGHIRHLQEARALGDKLVVSVTDDCHVHKGIGRPHFGVEERTEALIALDCVDDVIVSESGTAVEIIKTLRPAFYVKGIDYEGEPSAYLQNEIDAVQSVGGEFRTTTTAKHSSSRLLNAQRFPENVTRYLAQARKRDFADKIKAAFVRADRLKLLFVGETIVDDYCYVSALGKPSKEFMLATVEERSELFNGGVIAGALHCEWKNSAVLSGGDSLVKSRFIDVDFSRKLFEVYSARKIAISESARQAFRSQLALGIGNSDAVIVMDFGHGLLGRLERAMFNESKFLAVNAQTNAGNAGFNPVTLYARADVVCVDEPEARLAMSAQEQPITHVAHGLAHRMSTTRILITRGRNGVVVLDGSMLAEIPAFTTQTLDTIGAGDAFLATAAPLVAAGLELEAAAFAGNVAGAIKTTIVGHRRHVKRNELMQNIEALLA